MHVAPDAIHTLQRVYRVWYCVEHGLVIGCGPARVNEAYGGKRRSAVARLNRFERSFRSDSLSVCARYRALLA